MKKINKYLLILAVFVGFTSCDSEEFLSEPTPTDAVSDAAVYGSVSGVEAAMTGTYNVLRDYYASHDTAGSKAYYLGADVMATDVTCPDFNWYIFETRWDVVDSADGRRTNWAWLGSQGTKSRLYHMPVLDQTGRFSLALHTANHGTVV